MTCVNGYGTRAVYCPRCGWAFLTVAELRQHDAVVHQ